MFIRAMVRIFSFGERWNVPSSRHENILTIALINIHYLYNIRQIIFSLLPFIWRSLFWPLSSCCCPKIVRSLITSSRRYLHVGPNNCCDSMKNGNIAIVSRFLIKYCAKTGLLQKQPQAAQSCKGQFRLIVMYIKVYYSKNMS
jgi:hypothetical protein